MRPPPVTMALDARTHYFPYERGQRYPRQLLTDFRKVRERVWWRMPCTGTHPCPAPPTFSPPLPTPPPVAQACDAKEVLRHVRGARAPRFDAERAEHLHCEVRLRGGLAAAATARRVRAAHLTPLGAGTLKRTWTWRRMTCFRGSSMLCVARDASVLLLFAGFAQCRQRATATTLAFVTPPPPYSRGR